MDLIVLYIGYAVVIVSGLGLLAFITNWAWDQIAASLEIKRAVIGYWFDQLKKKREAQERAAREQGGSDE